MSNCFLKEKLNALLMSATILRKHYNNHISHEYLKSTMAPQLVLKASDTKQEVTARCNWPTWKRCLCFPQWCPQLQSDGRSAAYYKTCCGYWLNRWSNLENRSRLDFVLPLPYISVFTRINIIKTTTSCNVQYLFSGKKKSINFSFRSPVSQQR